MNQVTQILTFIKNWRQGYKTSLILVSLILPCFIATSGATDQQEKHGIKRKRRSLRLQNKQRKPLQQPEQKRRRLSRTHQKPHPFFKLPQEVQVHILSRCDNKSVRLFWQAVRPIDTDKSLEGVVDEVFRLKTRDDVKYQGLPWHMTRFYTAKGLDRFMTEYMWFISAQLTQMLKKIQKIPYYPP